MMSVVELAAVSLAKAVVKRACTIWLGDSTLASDASANIVEVLAGRVTSELEKRRLRRTFEDIEDVVAKYLRPLMEHEFRHVPQHEINAATDAVRATFEEARFTDANLFAMDLDAAYLDRHLRSTSPSIMGRYRLSSGGTAFYARMLRECCSYLIQVTMTLRSFNPQALTELLRRDTELRQMMEDILDRLPQRRDIADFEAEYRQQVVTALDRIHLFGANVSTASRLYQLSVAYLSLTLAATDRGTEPIPPPSGALTPASQARRVEDVLPNTSRLLVLGDAGFGKTTMLQWVAVTCATSTAPRTMSGWNNLVPFFIPLRRYAESEFPPVERFLDEVGRHIADEKPNGWVKSLLRSGRAVVLIDGVDELPEEKRGRTRAHIAELVENYPESHYIVTTRPPAVSDDWLKHQGFVTAELQRMTADDVQLFVHRWHDAMRAQCLDQLERVELDRYESDLIATFSQRRDLRRLAQTPLLCALICALHRERHTDLPDDRIHLYEAALDMMLRGRERERGIPPPTGLGRTEQTLVLQDVAYWLIRNELSDIEEGRVVERISSRLETMAQVKATALEVFRYLLERTGLLRQPVVGRVDFVHRTFQEYLAARAAVEADDIEVLVNHAHLKQWRDVVVMAAGQARQQQRDRLLRGLLKRRLGRRQRHRLDLDLVAVACLGSAPDLDPSLRLEIEGRAHQFLPPRNPTAIHTLAELGEFALDLLVRSEPQTDEEVTAVIETAARIGGGRFV